MDVRAQTAMVFHLDKCIGCHTCSVACKNVWTDRAGAEYMWWNNVETKPGTGYPTMWEDQLNYKGGWRLGADRSDASDNSSLTRIPQAGQRQFGHFNSSCNHRAACSGRQSSPIRVVPLLRPCRRRESRTHAMMGRSSAPIRPRIHVSTA